MKAQRDPFDSSIISRFDHEFPPPTPPSDRPEDLTYTPQPMVSWFTPTELARAGIKAVLSALFGAYADNREVQAALDQTTEVHDFSNRDEIWLDYVADLGDGWASTYTMARLLAEEKLELGGRATERGEILVMGGDQVYPTATREEYKNRLVGPYFSALPWVAPERPQPRLFAIPGNHDWYDGLTAFRRLFCAGRKIGGWHTAQERSYFAIRLPEPWWLWGLDIQLDADIDQPQYDFFTRLAADPKRMPPGSKVLLTIAEPSWVYSKLKGPEAYRYLAEFEKNVLYKHDHEVIVGLSGDLHTYARFASGDGRQRFVCGGGGAYLYPTHDLPERLDLPEPKIGPATPATTVEFRVSAEAAEEVAISPAEEKRPTTSYVRQKIFPSFEESCRLAWGSLRFPIKNARFSFLLGASYLWLAWLIESVSVVRMGSEDKAFLAMEKDTVLSLSAIFGALADLARLLAHAPGAIMMILLFTGGMIGFANARSIWGKITLGAAHAAVHMTVFTVSMLFFAYVNLSILGLEITDLLQTCLFAFEMLLVGGSIGGLVMGFYLYLSNRLWGFHTNEVFSCQCLEDYKCFLRLHVEKGGKLTLYPVGVRRVPRQKDYRFNPKAKSGEAWFEPKEGTIGERAELIEGPVEIRS